MRRRIGLIAGGAAVALAAVAGCSDNGTGNGASNGNGNNIAADFSPVAAVKATLAKMSDHKTVHVAGTMSFGGASATMAGDEQFGPDIEVSMNMTAMGTSISEIMTGDKLYMKIPQLSAALGGKTWGELDLGSLGSLGSAFQSLLDSAKNTDPAQQLQPLLAAGDLHKVGTETVDGVQTQHYAGTVDQAALGGMLAAKNLTPAQIAQLKSLMKAGGVTSEAVDLWIDSSGLPVRMMIGSDTASGAIKIDMRMSDWGKPVSITAPPADEVGDLSSMLGNLGGLANLGSTSS